VASVTSLFHIFRPSLPEDFSSVSSRFICSYIDVCANVSSVLQQYLYYVMFSSPIP
jgi:hypothetical protein